jgi:hypothetical protein
MYELNDYTYMSSAIANGYFSGLDIEDIVSCMLLADTKEEFDAAVSVTADLREIVNGKKK